MDENRGHMAGFTLVELLVAMALSLVVLASVSSAFISQRKSYDAQEQANEMIQKTRAVMEIITRDLKLAGFDPMRGTTGHTNIVGIPCDQYITTELPIQADLDGDGTVSTSDANEIIVYSLDSEHMELERNSGQAWSYARVLAENIQSFTFTTLDENGTATTTPADIRTIQITITAQTDKRDPNYGQNGGYRTYTLRTTVTPPNLGL